MSAFLCPVFNQPVVDSNGAPLAGGTITTYSAGSTTPITTFTSSTGLVPQANPITLNSAGVPASPIWLGGGTSVKLVLQTALGVTLQTIDNVTGVGDPASVTSSQSEWVALTATPTFLSATSFSVPGDQTPTLQVARRLQTTNAGGVVWSTVSTSSFAAGVTTVVVVNDASVLDAGLSAVSYGLLAPLHDSVPRNVGTLRGVRVIAATGTYTPTPGTTSVVVELVGAGGAGGGAASTGAGQVAAGAGGCAGGYSRSRLTSAFSGVTVTIGPGGVGASGAAGGNGGTTSFGAVFSATGGIGGTLGPVVGGGTITFVAAGAPGVGSSGNLLNSAGQQGGNSLYVSGSALSGYGGASFFGAGAPAVQAGAGSGTAATSVGAGGSGAALLASSGGAAAGGNGAQGLCLVWEYA